VVATGYGRHLARAETAGRVITEIKAHAAGAARLFPGVRTVIDIGGQDSKVIALDGSGRVSRFLMNDKCAAGTGRFLEIMAATLGYTLPDFGEAALGADDEVRLNAMCTVFAESEVISLKNRGVPPARIARAVHQAVVQRMVQMVTRMDYGPWIVFSGGVARNPCIRRLLQEQLPGTEIRVPQDPDLVGALGAALHVDLPGKSSAEDGAFVVEGF